MQEAVKGQQSGAIKGGGAEFPMFIARLCLRRAALRRVSVALLFGDLRKAYYSVYLDLVLGALLTEGDK